jgi:hypothetical protein
MEASHPSMMETSRATTSAVPPTADIVGHRGHVRKVPETEVKLRALTAVRISVDRARRKVRFGHKREAACPDH